ncbi:MULTISPECIES: autotransporter outer membrane beta-barrel domain-containing protein [Bradyrhizobium]|uniref:Autotransporter outer membrane beta-barrel domain-containing protein n=1 Tax=Bradyrhizobium arachidis TaxID=858423 RepID=A0AAE7NTE8_9BRAD|nr:MULTISPECIES: autotransporter outer membrane beta-barrel domain-containing protein [Bradyrhizobium]QOG20346.1 autotransporter domain-containing protein [Bradyrhizobium sp. SEMIA]QOZ69180.1 autotransporter outer membrane beta-barrel domain-containing protein [Bradyrhizobium arachidis]UFW45256.1 autotransporter outer membrane beta-barrel domain-containing protein [Bradyrhizobium arachidis]SFV01355.1 Autotransporter beta-domain-containing protein [Bradyrhizobium arachidis]
MKSLVTRKALWLGSAAFLALGTSAQAQNIDTMPQWNGTSFISSWGVPNTATYGQTFTPTSGQTRLSGFNFQLSLPFGTAPQYQAFVYAFDPTTQHITGSALFSSGIMTAPSGSAYQTVSINTGGVSLTPGQQYVLFLTTSTITGQPNSAYRWGALTNNTAIPNGQFVYQNNGTNFGMLSATSWSSIGEDLAMQAFLSGGNTGENLAQAQSGAFQLGSSYLSLLTDPFATNKVSTTGTLSYAGEKPVPAAVRSAFGAYLKAPPPVVAYAPHWDVWGAAFGGANNTSGNVAAGTSDLYTRVGGVAAGADYRFTADSLIGFSLAGGNINWSVTPTVAGAGNGGGTSDTFMAGVYGKYGFGPGYIAAAGTYTNYWMGTSRSTTPGIDLYKADFEAQGWGGRIEGGYKVGQYWSVNWTPYGAIQGQWFRTPGYTEATALGAAAGALTVVGRTATAYRGEVGLRTDKIMPVDNGGQLNLFGKFAYAHDEISNPSATLSFAALGGIGAAPFTVFGTTPARDLALTTAGAEWRTASGVSFLVKFDGEFSDRSQTYAGTGRIRYTW